jgi:hypothetical protein
MREDAHVNILPSPKGLVLEMERERSGWISWQEPRRSGECSRSWPVALLPEDCWEFCPSLGFYFYSLLHASTSTASVPTTAATIYSQSAQATSSYQRSEDFGGIQPDPLSGFSGLHWRARLIEWAPVTSNTPSSLQAATQPANSTNTQLTVSPPVNQSSHSVHAPSQEPTL